MIQHFCAVALDYQNGIFAGEDKIIAKLTGKAPMTVQDYVALNRKAFTADERCRMMRRLSGIVERALAAASTMIGALTASRDPHD